MTPLKEFFLNELKGPSSASQTIVFRHKTVKFDAMRLFIEKKYTSATPAPNPRRRLYFR